MAVQVVTVILKHCPCAELAAGVRTKILLFLNGFSSLDVTAIEILIPELCQSTIPWTSECLGRAAAVMLGATLLPLDSHTRRSTSNLKAPI